MVQKSGQPAAVLRNLVNILVFSVSIGARRTPEPSTKREPMASLFMFYVKLPVCGSGAPRNVFFQREIKKNYALLDPSNIAIFITPDPIFPTWTSSWLATSTSRSTGRVATAAALETWRFQPPQWPNWAPRFLAWMIRPHWSRVVGYHRDIQAPYLSAS